MINATPFQYIFAGLLFGLLGLLVLVMRGETRDRGREKRRPAPAANQPPPVEFLDADAPGLDPAPPVRREAEQPSADAASPAAFWDAVMTYAEEVHLPAAAAVERDAWAFAVALLHAREDIERLGCKLAELALDVRQAKNAGLEVTADIDEHLADVLTDRDAPALACHPYQDSFDVEGCALCALPASLHSGAPPRSGDDPIVRGHLPHIGRLKSVASPRPELRAGVGVKHVSLPRLVNGSPDTDCPDGKCGECSRPDCRAARFRRERRPPALDVAEDLPRVRGVVHRGEKVREIMRFQVAERAPCIPEGFHYLMPDEVVLIAKRSNPGSFAAVGRCHVCKKPLENAGPIMANAMLDLFHAYCVKGWHPEGEDCDRCRATCIDPMGADGPVIP